MYTLSRQIDSFSAKYDRKIKKTCEPLFDALGVNYFFYQFVTTGGGFAGLVSHIDFAHTYANLDFWDNNPFIQHPRNVRSGIYLINSIDQSQFQSAQQVMSDKYKIINPCLLVKQDSTVTYQAGFGIPSDRSELQNLLVNQQSLLYRFMAYFENELSSVLKEMSHRLVPVKEMFSASRPGEKYEIPQIEIENAKRMEF